MVVLPRVDTAIKIARQAGTEEDQPGKCKAAICLGRIKLQERQTGETSQERRPSGLAHKRCCCLGTLKSTFAQGLFLPCQSLKRLQTGRKAKEKDRCPSCKVSFGLQDKKWGRRGTRGSSEKRKGGPLKPLSAMLSGSHVLKHICKKKKKTPTKALDTDQTVKLAKIDKFSISI